MTTIALESPASTGIGARKDYHALNAQLNLFATDGSIQFSKDHEAVSEYLRQHVVPNTKEFSGVAERLDWLVAHDYYEKDFLDDYSPEFVTALHASAHDTGHQFATFLGAFKVLQLLRTEVVRRHDLPGRVRRARRRDGAVPRAGR